MFCSNCGQKNDLQARFCFNCGQPITIPNQHVHRLNTTESVNQSFAENEWTGQTDLAEDQDLVDFVGSQYPYYQQKWQLSDQPETAASWNWSAFLLGIFWLGYRKMFQPILVLLAVYLILDVIDMLAGFHPITSFVVVTAPYAAFVLLGMYGNALYYRHANKQIEKLKPYDPNNQLIKLKGGTTKKGIFASIGLILSYALIYLIISMFFQTGTITFGTGEGPSGITGVTNRFDATEWIYYEAEFSEPASTTSVDVILVYHDGNQEIVYTHFEEIVTPDWMGFYNYLYDPTYDYLEPGDYTVRVYRADQLLSEGQFSIKATIY